MDKKNETSESTGTQSIGEILKDIRLKNNISIEKLASHTKIRKENIVSIESDAPIDHIPQTYYRGYIRCYCLFFGIDPEKLLEKTSPSRYETPKNTYSKTNAFHYKTANKKMDESRNKLTPSRKPHTQITTIFIICLIGATLYQMAPVKNAANNLIASGAETVSTKENSSYESIINIS